MHEILKPTPAPRTRTRPTRRNTVRRLAALVALGAWGGGAQAQVGQPAFGVTLNGMIDLGARYADNSIGSMKTLSSGNTATSVLVIKGSEDLGDGLKASFWLESSFFADTGVAGSLTFTPTNQFFDRRSTVSLAGRFGELRLGRDWNPVFLGYVYSDPFFTVGVGSSANFLNASVNTVFSRAFGNAANPTTISRVNNAIEYLTPPTLGGFNAHLMVGASENANANGGFRYTGARVGYRTGKLDVSASGSATRIDAQDADLKQAGVAGSYNLGVARLSAFYTRTTFLSAKQNHWLIGAIVPAGQGSIKVSYNKLDQAGSNAAGASIDANDAQQFGLGYEYNLSKRSAMYVNASHLSNKGQARFAVPGGRAGLIGGGTSSKGVELGVRHAF